MTLQEFYKSLRFGMTYKRPKNTTRNQIDYQVGKYGHYPHIRDAEIVWVDDDHFQLICPRCKR